MLPQRHVPTGFTTCEVGPIAHPTHEPHCNDSGVMLRRNQRNRGASQSPSMAEI